ncbi:hypothetical protein [Rubrolithibacter danxiaensis]|uniref:hypothetical protein n=1 Tax=Rubrolithibacter danxiaensis TaxID=3390805 RepID=UPI003BF925F0
MANTKSLNDLENSLAALKYSAALLKQRFVINQELFNRKSEVWKSSPDGQQWKVLLLNAANLLEDIDRIKSVNSFSIKPRALRTYTDFINQIDLTVSVRSNIEE